MIREFRSEDKAQVNEIGRSLKDGFNIENHNEYEHVLVYEEDEKVLGFVMYMILYETLEIVHIAVDINSRRRGIARKLLTSLFDRDEVEKSILEVRSSNETAIKLYESLGFKRVRTIKNYYENMEDAIVMEAVK